MAKYIAFASYTPEAWAHIISEGIDREASIREIIERADGHLEMVYWLFSKHDMVGVFEIPDDIDAIALRYTAYSSCTDRSTSRANHSDIDVEHGAELFALIDRLPLTREHESLIGMMALQTADVLIGAVDELLDPSQSDIPMTPKCVTP